VNAPQPGHDCGSSSNCEGVGNLFVDDIPVWMWSWRVRVLEDLACILIEGSMIPTYDARAGHKNNGTENLIVLVIELSRIIDAISEEW